MKTIDLAKDFKDLYTATSKVKEVIAERGTFLSVEGTGAPGGEAYIAAIGALFAVAYTTKFTLKKAGVLDFKVPPPECVWRVEDPKGTPRTEWEWRLMIRVPDEVTTAHLKEVRKTLAEKKGLDASNVKRRSWRPGRALQIMHVGPYDKLEEPYAKLSAHADQIGAKPKTGCHEVYLSHPGRTAPDRLRTIVRMPISLPRPPYARGRAGKA